MKRIWLSLTLSLIGISGCKGTDPTDTGTPVDPPTDTDAPVDTDDPVDTDVPTPQPPNGAVTAVRLDGGGNAVNVPTGTEVQAEFDFDVSTDPTCADCRVQVVVGVDGEAVDCIYDDAPTVAGVQSTGALTLMAPAQAGIASVQVAFFQTNNCDFAKSAFEATPPEPTATVATIEAYADAGYGDIETTEETWTTVGSGGSCRQVDCPAGKTLLSFGVEEDGGNAYPMGGYPVDEDTVRFCGFGESTGEPDHSFTLQLTCGTPTMTSVRRSTSVTFPGSSTGWTTDNPIDVACGPGEQLTGYGAGNALYMSSGWNHEATFVHQAANATLETLWTVPPAGFFFTVYGDVTAICATVTEPSVVVGTPVVIPQETSGCAVATCPAGHIVIGGGYDTVFAVPTISHRYRYARIAENGNRWKVCHKNTSAGEITLTSEAWCLPSAP